MVLSLFEAINQSPSAVDITRGGLVERILTERRPQFLRTRGKNGVSRAKYGFKCSAKWGPSLGSMSQDVQVPLLHVFGPGDLKVCARPLPPLSRRRGLTLVASLSLSLSLSGRGRGGGG